MKHWVILSLLSFFFGTSFAQRVGVTPIVQKSDTVGSVYAVIIGISDYKNVTDLLYADKDALAFRDLLFQLFSPEINSDHIELFINESATRFQVVDAISRIVKKAQRGDRVYFYFAGHGDIEDYSQLKNGLLLLYDSPQGDYFGLSDGVLQVNQLADYFGRLSDRGVVVFNVIDACHSGKLKGGSQGRIHTSRAIQGNLSNESTLMLSCDQDQLSLEGKEWGGGRGIFSYYLEKGLKGLADLDRDQSISLLEIEQYVKRMTYLESEKRQTPVFMGDQNKIVSRVRKSTLDSLQQLVIQKSFQLSDIHIKGNEAIFLEGLDSVSLVNYHKFYLNLDKKRILDSTNENAYSYYRAFVNSGKDHYLSTLMRRKLAMHLNSSFDSLMAPILLGKKPVLSVSLIDKTMRDLDSCLVLFGDYHYIYPHLLSKKYVLEAIKNAFHLHISNYDPKADSLTMSKSLLYLHKARELEPNASYIYFYLGLYHQTAHQFDSSLVYLRKLIGLLPNSALLHNLVGLSLSDMGDIAGGIRSFKKALELSKDFYPACSNLAYVYSDYLRNYEEAVNWALRAMEIRPAMKSAHNILIRCYLNSDRFEKAIEAAYKYLAIDSINDVAWYYLGLCNYKMQDFDSAMICFQTALKFNPKFNNAKVYIALTYKSRKDYFKAALSFLNFASHDSTWLMEAAYCYKIAGLTDSARYYFSKTLQLDKAHFIYFWRQADLFQFGFSDCSESEKYYQLNTAEDSLNVDVLCRAYANALICKDQERAESYLNFIKRGYVPSYALLFTQSVFHFSKGNVNAAKMIMKNAISRNHEVFWWVIQNDQLREILD